MKPYRELTLADDYMFGLVMRQEKIAKPFLEGLLQCRIDHIIYTDVQQDLKPGYVSHGIRMDVYLLDEKHTVYDIEMQTTVPHDLEKRVRYYQSGIDRYQLRVNEDYGELRNSVIIFIMTTDYYKKGYPVYRKKNFVYAGENQISEYKDGTELFVLNAAATEKKGVSENTSEFLTYLDAVHHHKEIPETIRDSEYISTIEETIEEAKKSEIEEASYMHLSVKIEDEKRMARLEGLAEGRAAGLTEGRAAGLTEGRAAGLTEERTAILSHMLNQGVQVEQISKLTGISVEEIEKILKL